MFKDDIAVIDGIIMKGRCIIMPEELQKQALEELHGNCMGIERKQGYWHVNLFTG